VLAYPLSLRIGADGGELKPWVRGRRGRPVRKQPWRFDTAGLPDPGERLHRAVRGMSAGNMVYGLFRDEALERAGVFREVVRPDRLLVAELALLGEFRQVPELLWYRRFRAEVTVARQRAAFFPDGVPARHRLPWIATHAAALREEAGLPAATVAAYTAHTARYAARSRARKAVRRRRKQLGRPVAVARRLVAR
jgi:hypothetical protein